MLGGIYVIITSNRVEVTVEKYYSLDMFLGYVAMQNPGIFSVKTSLLIKHQKVKNNLPDKVQKVFPYEDLESIEILLEPLLKILIQNGDIVLKKQKELNNLDISHEMILVIEMIQNVWDMRTIKQWQTVLNQFSLCEEEELTTSEKVVKLLEKYHKYQLSLEHRKMVEDAKEIILIPSVYLGTQLGFNCFDSNLIIIVGVGNELDDDLSKDKVHIDKKLCIRSLAALGEINRMSIMQALLKFEDSIESIKLAEQLNVTPATISHHLKVLRQAGLVSRSKSGRKVHYVPERARLEQVISFLKSLIDGK